MKKIFAIIFTALVAITSCQDPVEEQTKHELNQDLTFTLDIASVTSDMAKIRVSHNGVKEDTWYGFLTSDVKTNDAKLISQKITELMAGDLKSELNNTVATTITLRDLESKTSYKYLAFGLSESGEIYGMSSSIEFQTEQGKVQMKENKAWKVVYTGRGTINEQEYEHTVTVNSSDLNTYFLTAYSVETFEEYGIEAIAEYELEYLKEWLKAYNKQYNSNITIGQMLFKGTGKDALNLTPGDWYAIAIGADDLGNLTGYYALSEVISIKEEEPTEAYASWLGDWTWTGANGLSYDITFHKNISNMSYGMTGWEGDEANGLGFVVEWMPEEELWAIYSQYIGTFSFGEAGDGDIFLCANDGQYFYTENVPVCVGGYDEEGNAVAYGYAEEMEDGSTVKIQTMYYQALIGEDFYWVTNNGYENGTPTFPAKLTKKSSPAEMSADSNERSSVQTFAAKAPKPLKLYYTENFKPVRK